MHKGGLSVICLCIVHTAIGVPEADFFNLGRLTTTKTLGQATETDCSTIVDGGFIVHGTYYDVVCVSS